MSAIKIYTCSICGLSHEVGTACPKPEVERSLAQAHGSASMFDTLEPSEIHTLYVMLDVFKTLAKLRKQIGHTVIGQHPDEINPRAETWMMERQNWETEVEMLRKRVSALESRLNDPSSPIR